MHKCYEASTYYSKVLQDPYRVRRMHQSVVLRTRSFDKTVSTLSCRARL